MIDKKHMGYTCNHNKKRQIASTHFNLYITAIDVSSRLEQQMLQIESKC